MADYAICDFETRSTADLTETGAWPYAEHPTTSVMWLCYAIGEGPVKSWRTGMADPVDLLEHVAAGGLVVAHNVSFEWSIWNLNLRGVHGYAWPELRTEQLDDTMARALVMALPASLEDVTAALQLSHQKDSEGHRLMLKMSKPVPARYSHRARGIKEAAKELARATKAVERAASAARPKPDKIAAAEAVELDARCALALAEAVPEAVEWYESPEDVERLRVYCARDIEAERALHKLLPPLSAAERRIWEFDQRVNIRGVAVDIESAKIAHGIIQECMAEANARIAELTDGEVPTVNSHAALGKWLRAKGADAPNTQAETIELLLESEHPDDVREVLELRRDAGKASVAKLPAIIAQCGSDTRVHWLLMFAGAGRTRRWAGRGAQPQNLPRPEYKQKDIEIIFALLRLPNAREAIELLYGHPITVLSSCLRSMFVAGPGMELTASDLSNIEGRVAAHTAGEQWKLAAFLANDTVKLGPDGKPVLNRKGEPERMGPDLYKVAYARTFGGSPDDVDDEGDERQIGKVMELFLQYEGGQGAFATGAATYGFDILGPGQKPRPGRKAIPADIVPQAIAGWRSAHRAIKGYWRELNDLAIAATENPGREFATRNGKVSFIRRKWYLFMRLPSGREIPYFKPHTALGDFGKELRYWGTHSKTRQWTSLNTYGGKLFENCLTGDSDVLTLSGWKRLDSISVSDLVFDGVEFVRHDGVTFNGVKQTVELDGVRMTPDHKVLTAEGWRNASSCEGFDRAPVGDVDRHTVRGFGRQKVSLVRVLRLRPRKANAGNGAAERQSEVLRLQSPRGHLQGKQAARDVFASGILRLAEHGRPVHASDTRRVEELRWPGDYGLLGVARLQHVLARHGADLRTRANLGPGRQFGGLFVRQLPVDGSQNAVPQHPSQCALQNSMGLDDSRRGFGAKRRQGNDAVLPDRPRVHAFGACVETGRSEPVFDIVNCGPRNRFVVRGSRGPFIVHNCVQAISRDIFAEGLLRAEAVGMAVVLHVHDAAVTEHTPGAFTKHDLSRVLCDIGPTFDGLPVSAKGYTGARLQK